MNDFSSELKGSWIIDGVRTPLIDYCGALGGVSPTDMGILVAREVIKRSGVAAQDVGSVVAGSMAQADFDAYMLPRHIGLYSGTPLTTPAILVQRICGTGFELFRQAADQIALGYTDLALVVGTESMTRNPIAAFTHRNGFKLGAPVEFKDFLFEALIDPAGPVNMIETAENLAKKYGITRQEVDAFAAESFRRALAAQERGFHAGEIVTVTNTTFELPGYQSRSIQLPRGVTELKADTHPRPSPIESLAKLRTVYPNGVQTAGNSSALVDGAAGALVASDAYIAKHNIKPMARLAGVAVVGVEPEYMGIGPAPAIRAVLQRCKLSLSDIGLFEINEAQGAQTLSVARELGLDQSKLNIHGGAIALGHPLAATGVRLTITLARAMRERSLRYGIASACIGGGQGIALLLENTDI